MDTIANPCATCDMKMPSGLRLSRSMKAPSSSAEPSRAMSSKTRQTIAITGLAFFTAEMTSSGFSWVKITTTATISSTMPMKERGLNRCRDTGSMASAVSCGASARISARMSSTMCLFQPGRARVPAGTAAFWMNGVSEIIVSSPSTSRPAVTARSGPMSTASSNSSCT